MCGWLREYRHCWLHILRLFLRWRISGRYVLRNIISLFTQTLVLLAFRLYLPCFTDIDSGGTGL